MISQYKRNHTIPRCMLDYWIDDYGIYPGVHVYDIHGERAYKSESRGKQAYSFAIENDLHIVDVVGQRATSLERWLSNLEGVLCQFLKLAHNRASITLDSDKEFKLVTALQALESRSSYELQQVQQYISQKQQSESADAKKLALENFINYVTTMAREFIPVELVIVHSGKASWLLSDRPFFHLAEISHRFVVLTNKVLVAYRKSPTGFYSTYVDALSVAEINRVVAFQARDWIVADSEKNLQKYISIFNEPSWLETRQSGRVEEIELPVPIVGWEIRE